MGQFFLGVDVGGTNIKLGVTDSSGKISCRTNLPTKSYVRNKKKLIQALIEIIQDLINRNHLTTKDFVGIGIGLPGLIDPARGIVKSLTNIPGWKDVALKSILEKALGTPVFLENDVNMITLGEWKFGKGKGFKNLICMTLGTGVGGGLILNDQLYRGEGYVAGELGHIPINESGPKCNCGGYGCFERYVGNHYLLQKIKEVFKRADWGIEDIYALAQKGDRRALKFWEETAMHIGNALTGIVNVLNPPIVIIGGGIANNEKFLFKTIEKVIKSRAMKVQAGMVKIVRAQLGNDAGILGAQVLVKGQI